MPTNSLASQYPSIEATGNKTYKEWLATLGISADALNDYDARLLQGSYELAQRYNPQFTRLAADERGQNIADDTAILQQFGPQYAEIYRRLQDQVDPGYAALRDRYVTDSADATQVARQNILDAELNRQSYDPALNEFARLLQTYNISGGLSDAEAAAVERETNKSNVRTGNAGNPNQLRTIGNAMNYGDRFTRKQQDYQAALAGFGEMLNNRTGALNLKSNAVAGYGNQVNTVGSNAPGFRTGVDFSKLPALYGSGGQNMNTFANLTSNNRQLGYAPIGSLFSNASSNAANKESALDKVVKIGGLLT